MVQARVISRRLIEAVGIGLLVIILITRLAVASGWVRRHLGLLLGYCLATYRWR
jgi:hypothetical protein